jgi:hypothetical protein
MDGVHTRELNLCLLRLPAQGEMRSKGELTYSSLTIRDAGKNLSNPVSPLLIRLDPIPVPDRTYEQTLQSNDAYDQILNEPS